MGCRISNYVCRCIGGRPIDKLKFHANELFGDDFNGIPALTSSLMQIAADNADRTATFRVGIPRSDKPSRTIPRDATEYIFECGAQLSTQLVSQE